MNRQTAKGQSGNVPGENYPTRERRTGNYSVRGSIQTGHFAGSKKSLPAEAIDWVGWRTGRFGPAHSPDAELFHGLMNVLKNGIGSGRIESETGAGTNNSSELAATCLAHFRLSSGIFAYSRLFSLNGKKLNWPRGRRLHRRK